MGWPWITLYARCPKCGNTQLKIFKHRDHIEAYQLNLVRILQKLLGAPLCYCWECRLQFYDVRPRIDAER